MSLRRLAKSLAPGILTEAVRSYRELSLVNGSTTASAWASALSPRVQVAIQQSRLYLFPKELRRRLSLVADIGANKGDWTLSLLRLIDVDDVWLFEPNPQAMGECQRRLRNFGNIHFSEIALGANSAQAVLRVSRASEFSSLRNLNRKFITDSYGADRLEIIAQHLVEIQRLDDALPRDRSVDIIKLDVQGYEREVLAGATLVLKRTKAILLEMNFHSHYEGDDVFESLYTLLSERLGFRLWSISSPYRGISAVPLWADALFINRNGSCLH